LLFSEELFEYLIEETLPNSHGAFTVKHELVENRLAVLIMPGFVMIALQRHSRRIYRCGQPVEELHVRSKSVMDQVDPSSLSC
jgi:hypothetical protein